MDAVTLTCKSFTYSGAVEPILRNCNFHLKYGEVTLLSGLSGCGKSTLLQLINGVIPRVVGGTLDGEVRIDGRSAEGWTMSQISRTVGSVLQNAELQIVHQKVSDEIAFGCENFGVEPLEIDRRIDEACNSMQLSRNWKTRSLSGGQKQRVVTASTLAMHPKILVFDEPLANLDREGSRQLLETLRTLAAEGRAILLVEHRLDVVLPFVDTLWVMENGTVHTVEDKFTYLKTQNGLIQDAPEDILGLKEPILTATCLQKCFGERSILKDVSFQICRGERLVLLGENGCGKSTLLNILGKLLKPDSGVVTQSICPTPKNRGNKAWFRSVGIVYQNPNYQLFMPTVREELSFGSDDPDYALEMAERFGLTPLLDQHPHSLSEGQKRRVTIAAILAQKPELLLLDEPTVGQDYAGLQQMVDVLNDVHRLRQTAMISVTHDFRCAAALCDRALVIEDGRISREGGKELVAEFFSTDK